MRVGVGYSENPDTIAAGTEAAHTALAEAGKGGRPCDIALLFATSRHDPAILANAIRSVVGFDARIVGGSAVGTMSNTRYGYAGDQIGLALMWLEKTGCDIIVEEGLTSGEEAVGARIGRRLAGAGVMRATPVMLFYDAIDRSKGGLRLIMATPLLAGMEKELGFLPNLVGAGLQGDYICSPGRQWTGDGLAQHSAIALAFNGDLQCDSVILHGCRPTTGYYTVTRAERQTILEIDGQPALRFLKKIFGPGIPQESYAFSLIFGINSGDRWGEFDEINYANRLCLAIDPDREGIVMFEPDMMDGTEFQLMHRSVDLDYIVPNINAVFERTEGRRPVFALYIDCAGRAAGYAGTDLEDATVVQEMVGGRTPFLGIYSGVEIAPMMGVPRPLDWTGVFCLFSVPK